MKPWVAIPLADGGFAFVDAVDASRVSQHRWRLKAGAPVARVLGREVRLARFVAQARGAARVLVSNGLTVDCRRENLRRTQAGRAR